MEVAGDVEEGALGGGNPEVGAASVKDDEEFLGRSAEANFSVILRYEVLNYYY